MKRGKTIVFVADFFKGDLLGGAENNDSVLIEHLEKVGYEVRKVYSRDLRVSDLVSDGSTFVVSNFIGLSEEVKTAMADGSVDYIIYEHDHKYLKTRDPSVFTSFKAPDDQIINRSFYENARAVVVLSKVCKETIERNLGIGGVYNIGSSLWSDDKFSLLEEICNDEKRNTIGVTEYGVLQSSNPIKGTRQAVEWCERNGKEYRLIGSQNESVFLNQLRDCERLVFVPQALETFSRLTAEAKMLKCKLVTTKGLIGFASEDCYSLSGLELIAEMRRRVGAALELFEKLVEGEEPIQQIKKVAFIGKFRKIYDEQGKALSLEKSGFEVRRFDENTFNKVLPNDIDTLIDYNPDVLIFTKLRVPNAQEVIDRCRNNGIVTVSWMPDLYFGLKREKEIINKSPMFQADFVFSPDGGNQDKFEKNKVNHFLIRQAIYDESCEIKNVDKKHDLLFVGTLGPEHGNSRAELLSFLEKEYGEKFYWAGRTGPHEIRNEALTRLISESKIVIGDCVFSDKYWSNRVYETLGRAGFLVHPKIPGIEDEFEDGKHLVLFEHGNMKELSEKINYYLNSEKEREKIRHHGLEYVKATHTLMNRVEQIMEILQK